MNEIDDFLHVEHYFSSGVYAKRMQAEKGVTIGTHKHNFDHLSILASGSASVTADGITTVYNGGQCIEIKAHVEHVIFALTDIVWFCIHATNETDPDQIDQTLIGE